MQEQQKEIRVLHVDDEPGFLALTKRHLEDRGGFCVETVTTAEEGLTRLCDGKYDVVVADYQMPVMTGLQFLRTLRADNNMIPVIIFTGRGREEVAIEALNSGANHYLQKGGDFESMFGTLAHALREVMEKKRMEAALCASEELYRTMIEHTGTGICILEEDATISFVNQEYERITGYSKEEVAGTSWTEHVFKEDHEMMLERHRLRQIDERTVPAVYELRLVTKSGAVKHMLLNVKLIPGTPKSLASLIDITDRKQTEEALRTSEERFRTLAEDAPFGISVMRADTSFAYLNPQFTRTFGYTSREIPDKETWFQKAYPDAAYRNEVITTWREDLQAAQTAGVITPRIFKVRCKNGEYKIIHFLSAALKDGTHIVTYEDITAQAEADKALRQREQEFQTIIDSLPVSIFHLDAGSRFVHVNEVLAQRYGARPEQFIGRSTAELFPEEAEGYMKSDREVLETGEPRIGKIRKLKTAQGIRWMRLDKVPIKDAEGKVTGIIGFELDVTEQRRLLHELEAKNRELEWFAYAVSHNLRSPLVTIQGFINMLQVDLEVNDRNTAEDELSFIANAAAKMDLLLRDTLELSRIGRITKPPEAVPFGEIVRDALAQTAGALRAAKVSVSTAETFPTVYADRIRIEEVLVNLISNSVKFMDDQSEPKLELGYQEDGTEAIFYVKDNGKGLAESEHEKVFELFYRVDKSTEGTGAGLALAKRIIEVHGGRIWITSEPGKGCMVSFTLPLRET